MQDVIEAIGAVVTLGLLYVVAPVVMTTYRSLRGPREVACPRAGEPAEIEIDAWDAAARAAFGAPVLRIRSCSRWPENERCAQECLCLHPSGAGPVAPPA